MPETQQYRKALGVLVPGDAEAERHHREQPDGSAWQCTPRKRPRSHAQLGMMFAALREVYDHSPAGDRYPSFETFRDALTIAAGHCDMAYLLSGEVHFFAKSWSFKKTEQDRFNGLVNRILNLIIQQGWVDEGTARARFFAITGEKGW